MSERYIKDRNTNENLSMYVKGSNTRLSNQFKRLIKNDPKAIKLKDLPSDLVIDYQTKQILKEWWFIKGDERPNEKRPK